MDQRAALAVRLPDLPAAGGDPGQSPRRAELSVPRCGFPRSFMHCVDAVDESVWGLEKSGLATRIRAFKRKLRETKVGA